MSDFSQLVPTLSDDKLANGLERLANKYDFDSAAAVTLREAAQRLRKYNDAAQKKKKE